MYPIQEFTGFVLSVPLNNIYAQSNQNKSAMTIKTYVVKRLCWWYTSITNADTYSSYRKVFNIRRTEFQNLNDSRPVLQLSLPKLLKPCIKSRMKM